MFLPWASVENRGEIDFYLENQDLLLREESIDIGY